MDFQYTTNRLLLKILPSNYGQEVLDFYMANKTLFETYEPSRPEGFYTQSYQETVLQYELQLIKKMSSVRFYVFLIDQPEKIIGTICFRNIKMGFYHSCEVGYKFDQSYWHQGYAKEALAKGCSIMFYELDLNRIEANVMKSNTNSIKLLDSLGFKEEGIVYDFVKIQGIYEDHLRYSLIKKDSPLL